MIPIYVCSTLANLFLNLFWKNKSHRMAPCSLQTTKMQLQISQKVSLLTDMSCVEIYFQYISAQLGKARLSNCKKTVIKSELEEICSVVGKKV